jgi:hypothetical protein
LLALQLGLRILKGLDMLPLTATTNYRLGCRYHLHHRNQLNEHPSQKNRCPYRAEPQPLDRSDQPRVSHEPLSTLARETSHVPTIR